MQDRANLDQAVEGRVGVNQNGGLTAFGNDFSIGVDFHFVKIDVLNLHINNIGR